MLATRSTDGGTVMTDARAGSVRRKSASLLVAALVLAGCSMGPDSGTFDESKLIGTWCGNLGDRLTLRAGRKSVGSSLSVGFVKTLSPDDSDEEVVEVNGTVRFRDRNDPGSGSGTWVVRTEAGSSELLLSFAEDSPFGEIQEAPLKMLSVEGGPGVYGWTEDPTSATTSGSPNADRRHRSRSWWQTVARTTISYQDLRGFSRWRVPLIRC